MSHTDIDDTLKKPEGLSAKGKDAYRIIMRVIKRRELLHTGGCKAFYSPDEWLLRGEKYGIDSQLIICHDGGDLSDIFGAEGHMHPANAEIERDLTGIELFVESCTGWYSAVYKR